MMKIHFSQRGNVLFLILIAVALFAALSYAITQSSRGGSGSIDREKDTILAAQIVQVGSGLRAAAMRLQVNGVQPANIHLHLDNNNASPCVQTDGTCLFTPEGGGAIFPTAGGTVPSAAYVPAMLGSPMNVMLSEVGETNTSSGFPSSSVVGAGSSKPDILFALIGIRQEVCEAINKGLGISGLLTLDPAVVTSTLPDYTTVDLGGRTEGCIDMSAIIAPGVYEYVTVLVAN